MTSTGGMSASRGTRYAENAPLVITPSVNLIASNIAPPNAITVAPSIWFLTVCGLTSAPQS